MRRMKKERKMRTQNDASRTYATMIIESLNRPTFCIEQLSSLGVVVSWLVDAICHVEFDDNFVCLCNRDDLVRTFDVPCCPR